MLQNVVYVFIVHPLPLLTQWTCYHCDEVHTSVSWKFYNYHFILIHDIGRVSKVMLEMNLHIGKERHLYGWQNNYCQIMNSPPFILMFLWKFKCFKVSNIFYSCEILTKNLHPMVGANGQNYHHQKDHEKDI